MLKTGNRIKKDDLVEVISGKEKGKRGKVLRIMPGGTGILIEKVNYVKRHTKPGRDVQQGGIIEKEAPVHMSNVMVVCKKCNEAVKVARQILKDGEKVRICKKCSEMLDKA